MAVNIKYRTEAIRRYFSRKRRVWEDFYPSERWILDRVARERPQLGRVLDVGCAAGGLLQMLATRYRVSAGVGLDINAQAIEAARELTVTDTAPLEFHTEDICESAQLSDRQFDLVTCLSVVDWNVDATGILAACWARVAPGGELVLSLRLTPHGTVCDMARSFQYIWYDDSEPPADAEVAPYHVFQIGEAIGLLLGQAPLPDRILAYGYWGLPSPTARTPFDRIVFTVFAVRKPSAETQGATTIEAHLPADALAV